METHLRTNKSKYPLYALLCFIVTLIVNYGSMSGWFSNTQEEISNLYRNFITPEPFTFSIWGVIYVLVFAVLIYQFLLLKRTRYSPEKLDPMNQLFILTCVFNILWNITWVNDWIGVSTLLIFIFTVLLGQLNMHVLRQIRHHYHAIIPTAFGIYFGWLTVATVTNVAAFLMKINWSHFGLEEHLITCLVYILVAILAGFIIFRIKNPVYNLPIIWAFVGIYATVTQNPPSTPVHWGMPYVIIGAIIALIIEMVVVFLKNDKQILPTKKERI